MVHLGRTSGLACAAVLIALAGCGLSSSSVSGDPVARAAFVSTGRPGYQLSFSLKINSGALPAPITGTGNGSYNVPTRSGSVALDMDFSSVPQVVQALGSSTMRVEEVIAKTTFYVKLPAAITDRVPAFAGKPWLKVDIAKAGAAAGIPGLSSLTSNPTSSDPGQLLQYLRATSGGTVTKVGSDSVNGVQATHYRAKVSLDRVPGALPPASRASARQAVAALERMTHLHEIPVDVWVDNGNLVRRVGMSFNETVQGQSLGVAITINILNYGPQPRPALPPADQVTDASTLAGASG